MSQDRRGSKAVPDLLPSAAPGKAGLSSPFVARTWSAMSEVVGERAAAALMQYMARAATVELLGARQEKPVDLLAAVHDAAGSVGFGFQVLGESSSRLEVEILRDVLDERLAENLRAPFYRGVFQGILATTPGGVGWGVLVVETDDSIKVTLNRGIA